MAQGPVLEKIRVKVGTKKPLVRALLGEFTGTLILVLMITTICAQNILPKGGNTLININIGVGLAIAFGVAITAKASGGHINPAVTMGFLVVQEIKPIRAILYMLAQLAGSFIAAILTFAIYYDGISAFDNGNRAVVGTRATAHIFASYPAAHLSLVGGFVDQLVGTAIFIFFILHIVDRRSGYPSWVQPYLIGTSAIMIGTGLAYNCGYPINPARDLGPRLFSLIIGYGTETFTYKNWSWVPVIAPMVGAVVGAYLYHFLIGFHAPREGTEYEIVATQELQPIAEKPAEKEEA